jgi:RNA polymerase sigma factor (sigma-70 family)
MTPWFSELVLRSQSDERLVALARAGQDRAVAVIVERYRQPLLSYARRINPGSEEDLVQQTFLSMLTALQSGTEVRHLRGWLYGILRNLLVRAHAAPTSQLEDAEAATESAEHVAERRMLALDALGALSQLPPRQHNALLQVAIHGRSGSEVSEVMGLSEGALRQLVHRARATVRAAVTALTPFPLVRWLGNPRSGSTTALTEATISTGTASGAVAVKLGVGALLATGVVAGGVISAVTPQHHVTRSFVARIAAGNGKARPAQDQPPQAVLLTASRPRAVADPGTGNNRAQHHFAGPVTSSSGPPTRSGSTSSAGGSGSGRSSGLDSSGRGGTNGGGGDGSGSDGGSGSQPGSIRSNGDGGSSGSDGGTSGSGGPGPSSGSDDGMTSTSGGDGGSGSGTSDGGSSNTSDGGSSNTSDGGSSTSTQTVDGGGSGSGDASTSSVSASGSGSTDGG